MTDHRCRISEAITIGTQQPLAIIAGPCVLESTEMCIHVGERVRDICRSLGLSYIFKVSFDKANRSSIHSARGPGLEEGLSAIAEIRATLGVPVTTDIHDAGQAEPVGRVVDLIQIPAFLCRQTDLLVAAAATGKPVNVKKGQFLSPGEMQHVVRKLEESNAAGMMLTERGTFFGYHRLVNDFLGLGDLMELGPPVCFDATHSTQLPGATTTSGGRPDRAPLLARAAVAAGVDALFIECHPDPPQALSDASNMLPLDSMHELLTTLERLRRAISD